VPGATSEHEGLTPRELEVARLLVEGLDNQEMAGRLGVSPRTVHAHLSNAMRKTGTRTRTQLVIFSLRAGLIPLSPSEADDAN
jgi:DNA-binding CsgD family transcriptional regulator